VTNQKVQGGHSDDEQKRAPGNGRPRLAKWKGDKPTKE
jgi:hypothetical protein